jgi:hypothetical protein
MPRVITAFIAATYAGGLEEAWGEVWDRPHGIVKGSVHGDLRTFALPFSEQIRSSEFGFTNIDYIPAFLSNEFSELMSSISNCTTKVVAYNETTNEGLTKASITMHRIGMNYNRVEVSHLDIAKTNNVWNIVKWDVDE